jgi:hypothetical protein
MKPENGFPDRYRFSLSGPRFQLAYVAALANGMSSVPFLNWCRRVVGLGLFTAATPASALLTVVVFTLLLSGLFFGAWEVVRRKFKDDPDLPESRRLFLLTFIASLGFILFQTVAYFEGSAGEYALHAFVFSLAATLSFLALVVPPVWFGARDARHGFFCAGLFWATSFIGAFQDYPALPVGGYFYGVRMAAVFLYFTSGIRVQRILAGLVVVLTCAPSAAFGLLGGLAWILRRQYDTSDERRKAQKELMEPIGRAGTNFPDRESELKDAQAESEKEG